MAKLKSFKDLKEHLELEEAKKEVELKDIKKAGWPWKKDSDVPKDMMKVAAKWVGAKASVGEINLFMKMLADS